MNAPHVSHLAALAVLGLFFHGCGGDDPDDPHDTDITTDSDTSPDTDNTGPDLTPPFVESTSPGAFEAGVHADATVTITFSEPMDQPSVIDALAYDSLGEVSLSWSASGTVLTLTPDEPLEYGTGVGNDPAAVNAVIYEVTLEEGTMDLAGNAMEEGLSLSFGTLKRISTAYGPDTLMTHTVSPSALSGLAGEALPVGDLSNDVGLRAAITFSLSTLPPSAVEIELATLATRQAVGQQTGNPYDALGDEMLIDHVSFATLNNANAVFNASQSAHRTLGVFCISGQVVVEHDVTVAVEEDRAERATRLDRTQYLLRFSDETNVDGIADRTYIERNFLELQLTYLAP